MRTKTGLLFLTWLGAAVRFPSLFTNTFHADEALFASWARLIAVWRDPLLQTVAVDKPPILFYLQALFYPLFGPVEWAARIPNLIASILLIPLVGLIVHRLNASRQPPAASQHQYQAWVAAGLVALSPLAIQFSSTGFTDPLMTFWVMLALWCVVDKRPVLTGLFIGFAIGTKYQGGLFLPLLIGVGILDFRFWIADWRPGVRVLVGLGTVLAAVVSWEIARTGTFTLWSAQMNSFGGVRLAWSWELWPRLVGWVALMPYLLGWGWLIVGVCLVLGVRCQVSGVRLGVSGSKFQCSGFGFQGVVGVFVVGYLLIHWLLAIPVWDRYLLPLVPLVAIWGTGLDFRFWILDFGLGRWRRWSVLFTFYCLLFTLLIFPSIRAAGGHYPIGSTAHSDQGAAAIAQILIDAPYGTVLYDHWYSWHWRYHFFDKGVYISWFPHGGVLAEELQVFGTEQRFIALPKGDVTRPIIRELEAAGFGLEPIAAEGNIVLYKFIEIEIEIEDFSD